jgi:hypothetical protein
VSNSLNRWVAASVPGASISPMIMAMIPILSRCWASTYRSFQVWLALNSERPHLASKGTPYVVAARWCADGRILVAQVEGNAPGL